MNKLPPARSKDVVVQELGEEVLVYDLVTHKAYCLNETSGKVYKACDGVTTFDQLRAKTKFTDEIIFLTLDELKKENLIEEDGSYASPFAGMSRREVIRRVGLASMIVLPVISSLVAPTAAMSKSCLDLEESCVTGTCCPGTTCNGVVSICCAGSGVQPSGSVYATATGGCASFATFVCCSGTGTFTFSAGPGVDACECT